VLALSVACLARNKKMMPITDMSALELSPFHAIALYKSTSLNIYFTYLLASETQTDYVEDRQARLGWLAFWNWTRDPAPLGAPRSGS